MSFVRYLPDWCWYRGWNILMSGIHTHSWKSIPSAMHFTQARDPLFSQSMLIQEYTVQCDIDPYKASILQLYSTKTQILCLYFIVSFVPCILTIWGCDTSVHLLVFVLVTRPKFRVLESLLHSMIVCLLPWQPMAWGNYARPVVAMATNYYFMTEHEYLLYWWLI